MIKIDYILKNDIGFHHKVYTIKQLEESRLSELFDVDNYQLIARRQFTGLHDKNKKEIFEGDVLQGRNGNIFICKYSGAGFKFSQNNGKKIYSSSQTTSLKIIGNIYENSELLKD